MKDHESEQWVRWISSIQAIAQNGLTYADNPFDIERYHMLRDLAAEMTAAYTEHEHLHIKKLFAGETGYATPKLDVRGVVFRDNKILLVQERSDGLWTLPGGWADVNQSPSESVEREIFEESGFKAKAVKLLALYDKQKHDHPPQLPHAYKCFFLCELIGGEPTPSIETAAVDFFALDNLPEFSLHRVTPAQIKHLFAIYKDIDRPTEFD